MSEIKNIIKPPKLSDGNNIRVIAPARSMGIISDELKQIAIKRFEENGFKISFGKHVEEMDDFISSSVESRISDLHDAFSDNEVDAIFTVIGGYNSNQLLREVDYDLIANNPKIICGFSDVTILANAINAKTGMITYLGPHFSSWSMKLGFEHSLEYFNKCLRNNSSFELEQSNEWSDDPWYLEQKKRDFIPNEGHWVINEGHALGRIVGGHVRCLAALQGTEYWPNLDDSILILEEDEETNPPIFDRLVQSLIHQHDFAGVRGIVIGRFQKNSNMTRELLQKIIKTKKELNDIPVIANADIGHTTPQVTIPIGGSMELMAEDINTKLKIIEH